MPKGLAAAVAPKAIWFVCVLELKNPVLVVGAANPVLGFPKRPVEAVGAAVPAVACVAPNTEVPAPKPIQRKCKDLNNKLKNIKSCSVI